MTISILIKIMCLLPLILVYFLNHISKLDLGIQMPEF